MRFYNLLVVPPKTNARPEQNHMSFSFSFVSEQNRCAATCNKEKGLHLFFV